MELRGLVNCNPILLSLFAELKTTPVLEDLEEQITTAFRLSFVQQRYDNILMTLKYTKHSKKREALLKIKRMYERIHMNN